MTRHSTSDEAFEDGEAEGRNDGLRRAFLEKYLEGPCTTWEAAMRINPGHPEKVNKDGTAAASWLRRAGLVVPTGEKVVPPGRVKKSGVLKAGPRAGDWLNGEYEPTVAPTKAELLRAVASKALALRGRQDVSSPDFKALLAELDSALDRMERYVPVKTVQGVEVEVAQHAKKLRRRDLRSPHVEQAARDGVWIRRDGGAVVISFMTPEHLHGAIKRCRKDGLVDSDVVLAALLDELQARNIVTKREVV